MTKYNDTLSYEIIDNGYEIYSDNKLWIVQTTPNANIFIEDGSFEENCLKHLEELLSPREEPNKYGLPNEVVNQIIDDTIMELIEQGVIE